MSKNLFKIWRCRISYRFSGNLTRGLFCSDILASLFVCHKTKMQNKPTMKTTTTAQASPVQLQASKFSVKRKRVRKPVKVQAVHKTEVVDVKTARGMLYQLFLNFREAIDQETNIDFNYNEGITNLSFKVGDKELKFNLMEGVAQ